MTNKSIERELRRNGFSLLRNGKKHALYVKGETFVTVSHGRMSPGAVAETIRKIARS